MQDVVKNPLLEAPGVSAFERLYLRRLRTRLAGMIIFLEKEQIDFGGRAAESRILQENRKGPRLFEIGRQELVGKTLRFPEVVLEVGGKTRSILEKRALDFT